MLLSYEKEKTGQKGFTMTPSSKGILSRGMPPALPLVPMAIQTARPLLRQPTGSLGWAPPVLSPRAPRPGTAHSAQRLGWGIGGGVNTQQMTPKESKPPCWAAI